MKRRILIVDDEPGITSSLGAILTISGYECETAPSAGEAQQLLQNFDPDLVISDVIMPGMNGVDFATELHASRPSLPIILLSGNAATQELLTQAGGRVGPALILPKPFSPRELLKLVDQLTSMAA